jgi:hypothetical protein
VILADQLIAAKLNIANGADETPVTSTIADADAVLSLYAGNLPYGVRTNSTNGYRMVNDAATLESRNKGLLTPGCGGDKSQIKRRAEDCPPYHYVHSVGRDRRARRIELGEFSFASFASFVGHIIASRSPFGVPPRKKEASTRALRALYAVAHLCGPLRRSALSRLKTELQTLSRCSVPTGSQALSRLALRALSGADDSCARHLCRRNCIAQRGTLF